MLGEGYGIKIRIYREVSTGERDMEKGAWGKKKKFGVEFWIKWGLDYRGKQ